jgi:hypothetical protein
VKPASFCCQGNQSIKDPHFFSSKMLQKVWSNVLLKKIKFLPMHL